MGEGWLSQASKSGPVFAESFLGSVPSGSQAFARVYGTIQTVSPTQSYTFNSKVRAVDKVRQSFPGPRECMGKRSAPSSAMRELWHGRPSWRRISRRTDLAMAARTA